MYAKLPKPFFVLAPMDEVTDTVFRQIIADCAPPDLYFTEFVNVDGLQSPGREKLLHKLQFTAKEKPLIAQLWGLNPENFYKTVKQIVDGSLATEANRLRVVDRDAVQGSSEARSESYKAVRRTSTGATDTVMRPKLVGAASSAGRQDKAIHNFAGVDLNFGCPVKTVMKAGACAAFIDKPQAAGEIIKQVKRAAGKDFPVSVKTRLGNKDIDWDWIEFLLKQKLNMLTIHGRTARQMSKVPANWGAIGNVVSLRDKLSPATLIIGNGDVLSRTQGEELAKKYNLDGIMIGRGIFHDPYAFAAQSPWANMSKDDKIALYRRHVELFAKTRPDAERKIRTLGKFCKIYINGFDGAKELREKLMAANTTTELLSLLY